MVAVTFGWYEMTACLLRLERAKGKQWEALCPAIRTAAEAFKSFSEGWRNFISVPGQQWEQVDRTEGLEGGETIPSATKQAITCAESVPPASAVTNRRWMKIAV